MSIKRVPQDNSDPIFDHAVKKFEQFTAELKARDLLEHSPIIRNSENGLQYSLKSKNGISYDAYIYPGGEVMSRRINGAYETFNVAYEFEDKTKLVDEMIDEALFIVKNHHFIETTYSKNRRIVYREFKYPNGHKEVCSLPFGYIRRFWNAEKKTTLYK